MTEIDRAMLTGLVDDAAIARRVTDVMEEATRDARSFARFLARFTAWNVGFGAGVCALAGKIARARGAFVEPGYPRALADRSVLVASYFFDAARDEFDDRDSPHRDTHRCLAQAALMGVVELAQREDPSLRDEATLDAFLAEPGWLPPLRRAVALGYGEGAPDDRAALFRSMGFHLGSELLADREFSELHRLSAARAEWRTHLEGRSIRIGGADHNAYQWIRIHSGHGGHAEADHFEWAVRGARVAITMTPEPDRPTALRSLQDGYVEFAKNHQTFFASVAGP